MLGEKVEKKEKKNSTIDMGWGKLIFANTFCKSQKIVDALLQEEEGKRDIAIYNSNPHLILSKAPYEIFLSPSHTYRLQLKNYRKGYPKPDCFEIHALKSSEIRGFNSVCFSREMVIPSEKFIKSKLKSRTISYFVAVDSKTKKVIGSVTGIDHSLAFNDSNEGSSLWSLAVDPQAKHAGIGEALVMHVASYYKKKNKNYLDLSVLLENSQAIPLYEKIGFEKLPVFSLKRKNKINESLYIAPERHTRLNHYSEFIIKEARKRGISTDVIDELDSYFALTSGGKTVVCRESLTDHTSAIALNRCNDKGVLRRLFSKHGFNVPDQIFAKNNPKQIADFLEKHKRVVVKAADSFGGKGIYVDLNDIAEVKKAVKNAEKVSSKVLLEEFVEGKDLRVLVINGEVIACGTRSPPTITGDGKHSIKELVKKFNRRRMAATGGTVRVIIDAETRRCIKLAGYSADSVLASNKTIALRKTSNVCKGGTIKDVTSKVNSKIKHIALEMAKTINIPVVGFDFIVPKITGSKYVLIEANARPDLTFHEPHPTAEKFIDFLFPMTKRHDSEKK